MLGEWLVGSPLPPPAFVELDRRIRKSLAGIEAARLVNRLNALVESTRAMVQGRASTSSSRLSVVRFAILT